MPLQPIPWLTILWEKLQIDIVGELHDVPYSCHFTIMVHNLCSKWCERYPASQVMASMVIGYVENYSLDGVCIR